MGKRDDAALFGNRFLAVPAPSKTFPDEGMAATDAMRLLDADLAMEGDPQRNLATFVTTWMEPEAQRIIAENLHRNFIDHAEYPISAEIEQRCVRMLADLFHAPGDTTGCRTQGSSEAIMLGALSLKWKWRERRQAAGLSTDRPNLVFGTGAAKDDVPPRGRGRGRGRGVEVYEGVGESFDGGDGPVDQVPAGRGEHGDGHVVGNGAAAGQVSYEVEVGLTG
jgi:hypothetical protein